VPHLFSLYHACCKKLCRLFILQGTPFSRCRGLQKTGIEESEVVLYKLSDVGYRQSTVTLLGGA
jgi:hypothetical protein